MSVIIAASATTPAQVNAALDAAAPKDGLLQKFEALSTNQKVALGGGTVVGFLLLRNLFGK